MERTVRVAVTGAGGFLGSGVCRALAERDYGIIGITRAGATRGLPDDLTPRVVERQADVLDRPSLNAALEDADVVVHCAARVSIDEGEGGRTREVNATGVGNVLQACLDLGIRRLIHVSSVHAYSGMRGTELNRNSMLALDSDLSYPRAKAAGHETVLRTMREGRIGGCIICPGAIIGPGDDRPSIAGCMMLDLARRKLPMLISEGYWWCDVRDVASAVAVAVSSGGDGGVYFTLGRYARFGELARLCSEALGRDVTRPSVPYWVALAGLPAVRAYAAARRMSPLYTRASLQLTRNCPASVDDAGARGDLGYEARPLDETVSETLAWFRTNGYLS